MKEKRRCLNGLRDRFGKSTGIAVCESDFADDLNRAEWSFLVVGGQMKVVDQAMSQVEDYLVSNVDAEVVQLDREWVR